MSKKNFIAWVNRRPMASLDVNSWLRVLNNAPSSKKSSKFFDGFDDFDGVIHFSVRQTPNVTVVEARLSYMAMPPESNGYDLDGLTTVGESRRSPTDDPDPVAGFELALSRALKEMKIIIGASANNRVRTNARVAEEMRTSQYEAAMKVKSRRGSLRALHALCALEGQKTNG